MKNKKIITMVVSLALVAVIGVGATLAYFTDKTDVKSNVVTMGKVDITLTETSTDEDAVIGDDGIAYDNIKPGDTISKIPTVTVAGDSEDAYIRVKIQSDGIADTDYDEAAILACIVLNDNWVKGTDGYYYYQNIATANEALNIFETVNIPASWGNEVADKSFQIDISAEALQADNVEIGDSPITSWPDDVAIEAYESNAAE